MMEIEGDRTGIGIAVGPSIAAPPTFDGGVVAAMMTMTVIMIMMTMMILMEMMTATRMTMLLLVLLVLSEVAMV